jgi:hypothetical protein
MPTLDRYDRLQEEIVREERVVGIRPGTEEPTSAIRGRRRQLEGVALLVFFGLVLTTLRSELWGAADGDALIDPDLLRAAMITCAGGFIAYALEKEKHLRRLTLLDLQARRANIHVADAILHSAALNEDVEFMHATLVLEEVVDRVAGRVQRRLDAAASAVRLLDAGGELHVAAYRGAGAGAECASGDEGAEGAEGAASPGADAGRASFAEQVALARRARRSTSRGLAAAPLLHYGRLLGVVEAVAPDRRPFDTTDLAVLAELADRAAVAVGNATAYRDLEQQAAPHE